MYVMLKKTSKNKKICTCKLTTYGSVIRHVCFAFCVEALSRFDYLLSLLCVELTGLSKKVNF